MRKAKSRGHNSKPILPGLRGRRISGESLSKQVHRTSHHQPQTMVSRIHLLGQLYREIRLLDKTSKPRRSFIILRNKALPASLRSTDHLALSRLQVKAFLNTSGMSLDLRRSRARPVLGPSRILQSLERMLICKNTCKDLLQQRKNYERRGRASSPNSSGVVS